MFNKNRKYNSNSHYRYGGYRQHYLLNRILRYAVYALVSTLTWAAIDYIKAVIK